MATPVTKPVETRSRAGVWARAIFVTLYLIVLIQICLFGASRLLARSSGPHTVAAAEITAIAIAELVALLTVWWWLRSRRRSLRELGLGRAATKTAWFLGIGLGLLTALWGLSNPALHLSSKLAAVLNPSPWHVYSALVAGCAAALCEETIFRGFIMQELEAVGYSCWVQVLGSALLFGAAHAGLLRIGTVAGLLVIVPTAILGAFYAVIYLVGKRSLMPVIASHFLNDAAVIPWLFLVLAARISH